jgi:RHS repeat-associated protein
MGLVGAGQSIVTNYTYQPFGATTAAGSANTNSYQFNGRENDATGLYFYRARYYSPTFQRFIAQDPVAAIQICTGMFSRSDLIFRSLRALAYSGGGYIPIWGQFGPGMQVTVGSNPDGTSFLNFKVGVGARGGFSHDPNGTSPGSDRICGKRGVLFNVGLYGEANADIPDFSGGVGRETGIYRGPSGVIPYVEGGYLLRHTEACEIATRCIVSNPLIRKTVRSTGRCETRASTCAKTSQWQNF